MKKRHKVLLTLLSIASLVGFATQAEAVNITVPSAPAAGYFLESTSTGAYIYKQVTSSLLLTNASGSINAYAGSSCAGSDQVTGISAAGVVTCSAQGSGGGSITFNNIATSTFLVRSTSTGLAVTSSTGANGLGILDIGVSSGYFIPLSASGTQWNAAFASSALAHVAVTLAGEDYLSLSGQQITANAINPDNLSASDFGDFTCDGSTCVLDQTYVVSSTLWGNVVASSGLAHAAVTLSGTPDYITLVGQDIVRGTIDISDDTNLAAGTNGIDLSGDTINFDSTEVATTTWGAGADFTWTFDASGTNPTLFVSDNLITLTTTTLTRLNVTSLNIGGDIFTELVGDGLDISGGSLIFDCSDVAGTGLTCSGEDLQTTLGTAIDGTEISLSGQATGTLMYFTSGAWAPFPTGTTGQVIKMSGNTITWGTDNDSGGGETSWILDGTRLYPSSTITLIDASSTPFQASTTKLGVTSWWSASIASSSRDNLGVPSFDYTTSSIWITRLQHSFNNFLNNSSFEHWFEGTSDVAPTGWVVQNATTSRVTTSSVGTYAVDFRANASDDAIYQLIDAGSSVWYTCSVYYKRISGTGGASIVLQENGNDFTEYANVDLSVYTTSSWNLALVSAQKPADGTSQMRCKLAQTGSTSTETVWYFDEVMLQEGKNLANGWLPRYVDDTYDNQEIYGSKIFRGILNASNTANFDSGLNVRSGVTALQGLTLVNATATGNIQAASLYATGNLQFDGEILPDGLTCSDGQILKKTGANNWDCATDETGGGGGGVATSSAGSYGAGNLAFFTATSTISATSGLNLVSSTGALTLSGSFALTGNASTTGQLVVGTLLLPDADGGADLGSATLSWNDLFLDTGGIINFDNGDVTITHSANALAFAGVTGDYTFDDTVKPASNDGGQLGTGANAWSDLFLANGGIINFNNGNYTVTHSAGLLTLSGGLTVTGGTLTVGTLAGAIDAGGATSLEIVNGSAPTVNAAGEIALDTTDNQLLIADSGNTARVFATDQKTLWAATVVSSSVAFVNGTYIPLPQIKDGIEVTQIHCYVDGGTAIAINLSDGTNDTESVSCGTTASSDTDITINDTFTASELPRLEIGNVTGTPNYLNFRIYGRITVE